MTVTSESLGQRIRERADYLWQQAGCPDGRDREFWERAPRRTSANQRRDPPDVKAGRPGSLIRHRLTASLPAIRHPVPASSVLEGRQQVTHNETTGEETRCSIDPFTDTAIFPDR
jgi:hypothetical protein